MIFKGKNCCFVYCLSMKRNALVCLVLMVLGLSAAAQGTARISEKDVAGIVASMTIEEKASCVVGLDRALFPPTNQGIPGRTAPCARLGVPSLVLADGTVGVRLSRRSGVKATAFPSNMGLASSWNTELAREVGETIGLEAVAYDVNVMLAPGMNIIRNPLGGRNFEYYSEDPVISGKMAAAVVNGIQSTGVGACVKHFACNNQETNRSKNDVRISERALREIYLRGFEIAVKESDPWTAMSAYNMVNGVPVQESPVLISEIMRGEWGFSGLMMTDWTIRRHDTLAQLKAGNDLFMPGDTYQYDDIVAGVRDGSLAEAVLDRACANVIRLAARCGYLPKASAPDLAADALVARKAACESAVLLKNDGMLPIVPEGNAALFGVRSYDLVCTGSGAGFVACPPVSQLNEAFKEASAGVDAEIDDLYEKYVAFASADIAYNEKIKVHIGLPLLPELEISRKLIEKAAERDAYAVITIGRTGEESKERSLKDDYYLSDTEKDLIGNVCEAFHARGKKVAVLLNLSMVVDVDSWGALPDAIMHIWFPGEEGGRAAYALLTGAENPSGRLCVTYPKDYLDCPSALDFPHDGPTEGKNYDWTDYSEGIYVGYRHFCTFGGNVSYPFGHGLSYTTFAYSDLKTKSSKKAVTLSFKVTNTGTRAGKEAVGVYVSAPAGGLDKPAKELKAFVKTRCLAPGESQAINIEIPASYLASFNGKTGRWECAKGKYVLHIGADVTKPRLTATVKR